MERVKTCLDCKLEKPISSFGKSKGYKKSYYKSYCKTCAIQRLNKWVKTNPNKVKEIKKEHYLKNIENYKQRAKKGYLRNPESIRKSYLRRHYKLTSEEYEKLFQMQQGLCAICLSPTSPDMRKQRLSIDHCHKTGKVRGLLCGNCNSGLGLFKDNLTILRTAVKYLRES